MLAATKIYENIYLDVFVNLGDSYYFYEGWLGKDGDRIKY